MMTTSEDIIQNLMIEIGQIRMELKAQQAANGKLRREKDAILKSLQECREEYWSLREELQLHDKMFQDICERKEKELAELRAIKSDLELRLRMALQVGEEETAENDIVANLVCGVESSGDARYVGAGMPHLPAQDVVEELCKWDGMEETIALFEDIVAKEKGVEDWVPGSYWNSKWQLSVRLYIACSSNATEVLHTFQKQFIPYLQEQCKIGGCCLAPIFLNPDTLAHLQLDQDYLLSVRSSEVDKCDIFVCLLGSATDSAIKAEVEHGYINNPLGRPCIFLFLPCNEEDTSSIKKLKIRIKRAGSHAKIFECDEDVEKGLTSLNHEILNILKKDFNLLGSVQGNSDEVLERIGLLQDMTLEWGQKQILDHFIQQSPTQLFGVQSIYDQLDEYIGEEGPVLPLLLTGSLGLGKSSLLAKWINYLQNQEEKYHVLYHFVECLGSCSADSGLILRRLLKKMIYICGEGGAIPTKPSQMTDYFRKYLEIYSVAQSGLVVIVIDNAEMIQDCEQCLWWILQPLPNNIRVVLSATEDNYPDSWRALPSPSIPTPTYQEMQSIVEFVMRDQSEALTLEQVGTLAVEGPAIPLWCVFATKHTMSVRSNSSEELDEIIEALAAQQEVAELLHKILCDLEVNCSWMAYPVEQILQLVYWSRNGIYLSELMEILSLPGSLLILTVCELERRGLITSPGDRLHLSHQAVQDAVHLKFSSLSSSENMLHWTECLSEYFLKSSSSLMSRAAEEVPWMLCRADLKEELYHTILNVDIFVQLCASGHGGELLSYWKKLDQTLNVMAGHYSTALKTMEEIDDESGYSAEYFCSMYRTVGKLIGSLGFTDEALPLMQHYLELCEMHFDPDGVEVATSFTEIAGIYMHAERYSAAEEYYNQALAIFERATGDVSPEVLKVVEALTTLHEKLKNADIAHAFSTRAYAIKDAREMKNTPSNILKSRATQLEQYCSVIDEKMDLEAAKKLNEYSVLLAVFGDSSLAEELFMRCWKSYEALFGETHLMVVRPIRNLALFYMQKSSFEKATSLYEKAYEILVQNQAEPTQQLIDVTGKLATLYRQQNHLKLAEPFQIKFIEMKEMELGPDHLVVAKALNNLAVIYSMQEDYGNALPVYDRALRAYRSNYPEDHQTVLTVIQNRQLAAHMLKDAPSTSGKQD